MPNRPQAGKGYAVDRGLSGSGIYGNDRIFAMSAMRARRMPAWTPSGGARAAAIRWCISRLRRTDFGQFFTWEWRRGGRLADGINPSTSRRGVGKIETRALTAYEKTGHLPAGTGVVDGGIKAYRRATPPAQAVSPGGFCPGCWRRISPIHVVLLCRAAYLPCSGA